MKEKIYMTQEDYDKYILELNTMRKELEGKLHNLSKIEMLSGESFYTLTINIKHKIEELRRIVIKEKLEEDIVNLNDIVTVDMIYPDSEETVTFELVSGMPDLSSSIMKISIDSPLGKEVYQQKIGDELSFVSNGEKVRLRIVNKVKPQTLKLD